MSKTFTMSMEMAAYLVKHGLCAVCWTRKRRKNYPTCKRCAIAGPR